MLAVVGVILDPCLNGGGVTAVTLDAVDGSDGGTKTLTRSDDGVHVVLPEPEPRLE